MITFAQPPTRQLQLCCGEACRTFPDKQRRRLQSCCFEWKKEMVWTWISCSQTGLHAVPAAGAVGLNTLHLPEATGDKP